MKILIEVEGERIVSARVVKRAPKKISHAVEVAIEWLRDFMLVGPRQSVEIFLEADSAGIHKNALYVAKRILGIRHFPVGYRACDGWTWELRDESKQANLAHKPSRDASPMDAQMETFVRLASRNGIESREESGIGDDCDSDSR